MTQLEIEANALATQLDNPASVMIRKLLEENARLCRLNDQWRSHYWKVVRDLDELKEVSKND